MHVVRNERHTVCPRLQKDSLIFSVDFAIDCIVHILCQSYLVIFSSTS